MEKFGLSSFPNRGNDSHFVGLTQQFEASRSAPYASRRREEHIFSTDVADDLLLKVHISFSAHLSLRGQGRAAIHRSIQGVDLQTRRHLHAGA